MYFLLFLFWPYWFVHLSTLYRSTQDGKTHLFFHFLSPPIFYRWMSTVLFFCFLFLFLSPSIFCRLVSAVLFFSTDLFLVFSLHQKRRDNDLLEFFSRYMYISTSLWIHSYSLEKKNSIPKCVHPMVALEHPDRHGNPIRIQENKHRRQALIFNDLVKMMGIGQLVLRFTGNNRHNK